MAQLPLTLNSIPHGKPLAGMLGLFDFIEHGDGKVGKADPAFAFAVDQQAVCAQAELARALTFDKLGRR